MYFFLNIIVYNLLAGRGLRIERAMNLDRILGIIVWYRIQKQNSQFDLIYYGFTLIQRTSLIDIGSPGKM